MIISRSDDDLPLKASDSTHAMSYSTAETTACNSSAHVPRRGSAGLEESIHRLERQTEYLIRNMRFDNVALQSRDEDMRKIIVELEDELTSLQKIMIDESNSSCKNLGSEDKIVEAPLNSGNLISHEKKKDDILNKSIELSDTSQDGIESLDLSISARSTIGEKDLRTKQHFRGIFNWGSKGKDRRRLSSSISSTASESNSTAGSNAGRRRRRNKEYEKQSPLDEDSVASHAASVSSAPLFQWFGDQGRSPRNHNGIGKHNNNIFNRMFQRKSMNGIDKNGISSMNGISEENSSHSNTSHIQQDAIESETIKSKVLQQLDLKLNGCDLAKSSLHELHTLQARSLLDWQQYHAHKQIDYEVESNRVDAKLEEIRNKFAYCQKENKRRQRLLKEAMEKAKKANNRAELLQEEVECVRTELFALNRRLSQSENSM